MRGAPGKVPVHDPDPGGGEHLRVVRQGLVQQHLLSLALVPAAAGRGTGRPGGHGQGGPGGGMRAAQLAQLRVGRGVIGGAGRPERLAVRRGVRYPGQRPVDRAGVQVPDGDSPVIMRTMLGVYPGQQPVPQLLQRLRADRLPPGGGDRRVRQPIRALPRHQGQVPEQRGHHLGVVRVRRHQRHQQGEPDRQRAGHRPPRRALDLPLQDHRGGDLVDDARRARQLIQPFLGHPQAGVISRVPGRLHPPVAADHRARDRHRLAERHQVPGGDPARPGRDQRRAAAGPRPPARRPGQVRHPDRDHPRPAQQLTCVILPGIGLRMSRGGGTGGRHGKHVTMAGQRSSLAGRDLEQSPPLAELRCILTPDTPRPPDRDQTRQAVPAPGTHLPLSERRPAIRRAAPPRLRPLRRHRAVTAARATRDHDP